MRLPVAKGMVLAVRALVDAMLGGVGSVPLCASGPSSSLSDGGGERSESSAAPAVLNVAETDVDAMDVERDVDEALVGRVADVVGAEPEDSSGGGVVNS